MSFWFHYTASPECHIDIQEDIQLIFIPHCIATLCTNGVVPYPTNIVPTNFYSTLYSLHSTLYCHTMLIFYQLIFIPHCIPCIPHLSLHCASSSAQVQSPFSGGRSNRRHYGDTILQSNLKLHVCTNMTH